MYFVIQSSIIIGKIDGEKATLSEPWIGVTRFSLLNKNSSRRTNVASMQSYKESRCLQDQENFRHKFWSVSQVAILVQGHFHPRFVDFGVRPAELVDPMGEITAGTDKRSCEWMWSGAVPSSMTLNCSHGPLSLSFFQYGFFRKCGFYFSVCHGASKFSGKS